MSLSEVAAGASPVLGLCLARSPSVVGNSPGVLFLVTRLCALGAALTAAFDVGALDVWWVGRSAASCGCLISKFKLKILSSRVKASACRPGSLLLPSIISLIESFNALASLAILSAGHSTGSLQCCG